MSYETIYKYDQRTVNARDAAKALNAYCGALAPQGMTVQNIQQYRLENNDDLLLLYYVAEYYNTASGNPATFSDGADDVPVKALTANIDVNQQGSGTPDFENPRLFTKITDVTVTRTDDNDENEETYTVSLEAAGGGIYGGSLNVTTGELTVTHAFVEFVGGTESWGISWSDTNPAFYLTVSTSIIADSSGDFRGLFSLFPGVNIWSGGGKGAEIETGSDTRIFVRYDDMPATTTAWKQQLATWKEAGTPLQAVYKLKTPNTVQLAPAEVRTLLGGNKISADTGDVSVTYRAVPSLGLTGGV